MEYWEFLLQKEGDRSWLPIKSPKLEIEAGRYRVVAHSSSANTDVEICVMHESTEENPPRRRFQKRSRRTNPEGLMVVIPFTDLKPGSWELRCCGDIMSDLLGKSWKKAVCLDVLAKTSTSLPPEPVAPVTATTETELSPNSASSDLLEEQELREREVVTSPNRSEVSQQDIVEHHPTSSVTQDTALADQPIVSPDLERVVEPLSSDEVAELTPVGSDFDHRDEAVELERPETNEWQPREVPLDLEAEQLLEDLSSLLSDDDPVPSLQMDEAELPSATPAPIVPQPLVALDEQTNSGELTSNPVEATANPILDQSLQMLEQILQQVLEPVLQEFDRPESSQQTAETAAADFSEAGINEPGVMLTLDKDALVARRGEPLTITGQVDALAVDQLSNGGLNPLPSDFHGRLRYELRDPQTLRVLLNVQKPLPEQALPLAFHHTLEIPPDCNTRLMLGKVMLYGSSSRVLASQPFSVTADLDELLGAIIPESKAMPVAKMLVLSNKLAAAEALQQELIEPPPPLNQALLDLVDAPGRHQPLSLEPVSGQTLPPQLHKSAPTSKTSKSLQLPKLPTSPIAWSSAESVEVTPDEAAEPTTVEVLPQALTEAEHPVVEQPPQAISPSVEAVSSEEDIVVIEPAAIAWDEVTWSDAATSVVGDSESDVSEATEAADSSVTPEVDSPPSEVDTPTTAPVTDEATAVDSAFQALNLHDRFWLRLNSLAADAELSEWLKFELSPSQPPTDTVRTSPAEDIEVTEQPQSDGLLTDFDESLWEGADDVGTVPAEVEQLQPPDFDQAEPPLVGVEPIDWTEEIVVEDEEPSTRQPIKHDASGMAYPLNALASEPEPEPLSPLELESPLPAPVLTLPTTELAAGEAVIIRIKLLPYPSRLCIKLWVQDRLSRSLLDGPRWLVDLLPDGAGNLEAMTQLIVPFGTTEIRFEAIAVDIYSQRESHKVAVDCVVVPPDLPDFSLDEFEA